MEKPVATGVSRIFASLRLTQGLKRKRIHYSAEIRDAQSSEVLRDAKLYEIGADTPEVHRTLIGRELFNETRWNGFVAWARFSLEDVLMHFSAQPHQCPIKLFCR